MKERFNKTANNLQPISYGFDYSIINNLIRIMKKINIFIWCNKEQILDILNIFNDYKVNYEILVWCKNNPMPLTNNLWLPDIEYCLYFRDGIILNNGYEIKSKWYQSQINKKDKDLYEHPTIKPLDLVKRHLLHTTKENDIVADFFLGSGTTCVAAKEIGRQYIGFEIDKLYYDIAKNRLNGINANGQQSIFTTFEQDKMDL